MVGYVHPDGEMLEAALALAAEIAENPVWQMSQVKALVHQNYLERDVDKALTDEGAIFRKAQGTDAHREALTAFREKRQPRFHGV